MTTRAGHVGRRESLGCKVSSRLHQVEGAHRGSRDNPICFLVYEASDRAHEIEVASWAKVSFLKGNRGFGMMMVSGASS